MIFRLTTVHEKRLDSRFRGNDNLCVIPAKAGSTRVVLAYFHSSPHCRQRHPNHENVIPHFPKHTSFPRKRESTDGGSPLSRGRRLWLWIIDIFKAAKNLGSCEFMEVRRSFLRSTQDRL